MLHIRIIFFHATHSDPTRRGNARQGNRWATYPDRAGFRSPERRQGLYGGSGSVGRRERSPQGREKKTGGPGASPGTGPMFGREEIRRCCETWRQALGQLDHPREALLPVQQHRADNNSTTTAGGDMGNFRLLPTPYRPGLRSWAGTVESNHKVPT